jgi:hypothetical protein
LVFELRPNYQRSPDEFRLHGINNWNKSNDSFYDVETDLLAGYEFESDAGDICGLPSVGRRAGSRETSSQTETKGR